MNIGILIYDGVDDLDFVGPQEVFSIANVICEKDDEIFRVARSKEVTCGSGTRIIPEYDYDSCPMPDCLVVPGGPGSRQERYVESTQRLIKQSPGYILSVCTGSLILAECGLLDGKKATTHHLSFDELRKHPLVEVVEGARYVKEDRIICSAGIVSGIDAALYLLEILNPGSSGKVAKILEYEPSLE